jgi:hypothetical protein
MAAGKHLGAVLLLVAALTGVAAGAGTVGVGHQLATVVASTTETVRTEFESTAFEVEFEDEVDLTATLEQRAQTLADRAARIRTDYRNATRAYRVGNSTAGSGPPPTAGSRVPTSSSGSTTTTGRSPTTSSDEQSFGGARPNRGCGSTGRSSPGPSETGATLRRPSDIPRGGPI